jgi:hypothetical protein
VGGCLSLLFEGDQRCIDFADRPRNRILNLDNSESVRASRETKVVASGAAYDGEQQPEARFDCGAHKRGLTVGFSRVAERSGAMSAATRC